VTGERFIPFRKTNIVTMCADEVPAEERESFEGFAELLASLLHHEFRGRLEALKDSYYPFNPDADTRTIGELSADERHQAQQRLVDELSELAEGRELRTHQHRRPQPRVRRGIVGEGSPRSRLRRLRAGPVLPSR
jgi:hypothetical protein